MDNFNNYNDTSDIDLLLKVLDRIKGDDDDVYGNTQLHHAIKENQTNDFHQFLKKIDLNLTNHNGETPLHCAVAYDRYEFTKILLEHGANVNARDNNLRTPLYHALEKENIQLAEILFKYDAVLNEQDHQSLNTLNIAISLGNIEMIKLLMKNGWSTIDIRCCNHYPICLAVQSKNLQIVKYLMENGYKNSGTINEDRLGLLDICIALDSVEILQYLIDIGVKTKRNLLDHSLRNLRQKSWKYILTCHSKIDLNVYLHESELHLAVRAGDLDFVKIFVNSNKMEGDVRTNSPASRLAVYIAVENGDEEILQVLLKAGYSSESCFNDTSPLHLAATFNHTRLVKILLDFGANVNSQTLHRYTPLHFAAASGQSTIVKFLLQNGADPTNDCENHGSPLSFALRMFSCRVDRSPVTPLMFKNLVQITQMLIQLTRKNVCRLLTQASSIWISNDQQTKQNSFILLTDRTNNNHSPCQKIIEFRPEMLRTIFNHLTDYEIQCYSQFLLQKAHGHDTPLELLNFLIEYNDSKSRYSITINGNNNLNYKSRLLLLDYSKNVEDLLNQTTDDTFFLKFIVARLVLLTHCRHTGMLKFCTKHKLLDWRNECERQKFQMRGTQIFLDLDLTLHDILMKPINNIVKFMRNEKFFLKKIETSYGKYSAYDEFLKINVNKCLRRKEFLDECEKLMFNLIKRNYKIQFSKTDIEEIFQYLSVVDLQRFLSAFT